MSDVKLPKPAIDDMLLHVKVLHYKFFPSLDKHVINDIVKVCSLPFLFTMALYTYSPCLVKFYEHPTHPTSLLSATPNPSTQHSTMYN